LKYFNLKSYLPLIEFSFMGLGLIMKTAYIVKAYRTAVGKAPKACSDLKT
jgi:hypothetical protein